MSDLISRRKIRDYIKGEINPYGKPFEGTAYELGLKIMRYIDAMDSAYDIDKIVKELETDSSVKLYGSGNSDNYLIPVKSVIEIVKQDYASDDGVCERTQSGDMAISPHTFSKYRIKQCDGLYALNICPHCRKKIKVVE